MTSNKRQMQSPSFRLAVADPDFLLSDEMRSIRFALEYAKAEQALRQWGVRSTIVVFGSARIPSPEEAKRLQQSAKSGEAEQAVERKLGMQRWYTEARAFARIASERGGALHNDRGVRDNVIATGGGPGIMEAANRGATDSGAPSIGFNISLPHEQEPNAYSTPALTFRFHYFAMRKMHLAMRANALVAFPGGYGTLDELFEILTLEQTRKAPAMPVVLFGRDFWRRLIDFDVLIDSGMIERSDLALFEIVDTAEEGWEALTRRGLSAHSGLHNL